MFNFRRILEGPWPYRSLSLSIFILLFDQVPKLQYQMVSARIALFLFQEDQCHISLFPSSLDLSSQLPTFHDFLGTTTQGPVSHLLILLWHGSRITHACWHSESAISCLNSMEVFPSTATATGAGPILHLSPLWVAFFIFESVIISDKVSELSMLVLFFIYLSLLEPNLK